MFFSAAVVLYQLLFVLIMFVASRLGHVAMAVALVLCLIWTATHLFFPPLVVLQSVVIIGSYAYFRKRVRVDGNSQPTQN